MDRAAYDRTKNATEGVVLNGQRSVLIVDRSEETREVLQTVLERRGVRTLAADRAKTGLELAQRHRPDLIVVDLETCDAGVPPALGSAGGTPAPQYQPQLILLGSLRGWRSRVGEGEFVAKPYHYGPLIRKIEELLGNTRESGPCRRCSSSAEPTRAAVSN
jgi:DNA-binding NtrC family response regulator